MSSQEVQARVICIGNFTFNVVLRVAMALVVTQISLAAVLQDVESGRSAADASVNDLPPAPAKVDAKAEPVRATGCPFDGEQPRARKGQAVSYSPLSPRCKFHLFVRQTYSPYTFASAGFQSLVAQATDQWPHYGGGTTGWSKRLGATLADTESRRFIQGFALSTILHQDPRYFPSPKHALLARAWYAATRVVVARCDDGHVTFNSSEFLGALFTSSLENAYYPRHDRSVGDTMSRFAGALSSDVTGNLLREFTPDIKRLFRRHTPAKIKKIERKLPIPEDDKL